MKDKHSENVSCADNQQERLIGWITGFVDGEGCFSMGLVKQSNRKETQRTRKGYKTGYQVFHEFSVTQGESSLSSLEILKDFFGVGRIYINKRYDNHKEHLYRYVVRKREELVDVIIPFFKDCELKTSKFGNFKKFVQCMDIISEGRHLNNDGLIEILKITEQMNHKKSRKDLIRILRYHTSESNF